MGASLSSLVVNVAVPSIRRDLGGGITGLQWVVDGLSPLGTGVAFLPMMLVGHC